MAAARKVAAVCVLTDTLLTPCHGHTGPGTFSTISPQLTSVRSGSWTLKLSYCLALVRWCVVVCTLGARLGCNTRTSLSCV